MVPREGHVCIGIHQKDERGEWKGKNDRSLVELAAFRIICSGMYRELEAPAHDHVGLGSRAKHCIG